MIEPQRLLRHTAMWMPFIVFLAVYGTFAGRGFIADDYEWALSNRARSFTDVADVFSRDNGFFRPLVGLSFTVNEYLFGTDPRPYGYTNVGLAGLCAVAVYWLARGARLPRGGATLAAALWLLNFHGINMAVLWLSGRTALLLTLCSALSLGALVRGRWVLAICFLTGALFSKEEAVMLPAIGLAWILLLSKDRRRRVHTAVIWSVGSAAALAAYFSLRFATDAMVPSSAPSYYRLTFEPEIVLRNTVEYVDRSATFSLVVLLLALIVLRTTPPVWTRCHRLIVACSVLVIGGFAITVFLPVRSSLYACFPSVGVALASGALVSEMWSRSSDRRRTLALYAALVLPLLVAPIHVARADRWVSIAEFSSQALADLEALTKDLPDGSTIVLHDDRATRANLASAFGTLLSTGYRFHTNRDMVFWIEPPSLERAGDEPPCVSCADAEFFVRNGRVVR